MAEIASSRPRKRCAVYCRVSSDERLDQEFNSIDAQKEAGHAFIASQRAEGWIPVVDDYDDPGYSGGNTERPALKRLLADIERGLVDIVVVYKIDRLTRSLADFSKMVEVFERHEVSFVSVTQQFNTTTSMGRLILNVLLSFAQFEREVTGERIRDKIAAAKKKGMWMGGVPTIGYDVVNRQLVVNPAEAAVVRRMFEEMLTIGSPTQIAARLTAEGVTTKAWTTQDGRVRTGTRIDKKYIHKVLRNRIYLGELSNRGQWYPAQHEPIIERQLWDQVHAVLARDSHARSVDTKIRSRNDALLRGLLYAPTGERMYPTYSRKNGRKYQYYVSKSESRFGAPGKSYERLPAGEIEAAVVAQIRTVLTSPESVAAVVRQVQRQGAPMDEAAVVMAMGRLNDVWDQLFPVERHRIANLMIERIDLVHTDEMQGIKVKWRELGWDALIGEFAPRSIGAELLEVEA
ncbi:MULTISPECIES: recombinase family protein [Burkholderiales]|uniref:recombinase family protein n=1 Tax=Burkholderiales TaxID=80840 RepID=UPI0007AFF176|nr:MULTISPECIES: recombinase family protein [Burkholderiales]ANA32202.1 recombinase [Ralstonia mannitolilytica]PRE26251.1 recombinase family protein [Burkholderia multivorans]UXZ83387.1 recombinase family protein [Burkholderia multivorans]UZG45579.1 recombinase family protein [Caldimonas thermodepolymerans]